MAPLRTGVLGLVLIVGGCCAAEPEPPEASEPATESVVLQDRIVDASCGQCQLDLPGSGCDLAIAFDGTAYYVDGSHIDDHGDAHGADGLCNAVRRARVTGRLVDGRVAVEEFVLIEDDRG